MASKRAVSKEFGTQKQQLAAMAGVVKEMKGFKPVGQVLTRVEAVPTIFPQYDRITQVAGHPLGRVTLLHGPSNEGKSSFALGLGASFLQRNHFFGLVDAEKTTPPEWLRELMGEYAEHPGFVALPASGYEDASDGVRDFCERIALAREKEQLPPETRGLVVVDSIRKLVPKTLLKNLMAGAAGSKGKGVDGFGGRAAQMKAALNAAWMDELVPLMHDTGCAIMLVARETDDPDAGMYDEGIKVGGGKAAYYDSSLVLRVSRSFIPHPVDEQAKRGAHVGERHMIELRKTKVGKKEDKRPRAYFHTSNGVLSPAGFDLARDVLELGVACGVIDQAGSYFKYDGKTLGQGQVAALSGMRGNAALFDAIERDVRMVACGRGDEQKGEHDVREASDAGRDQEPGQLQQQPSGSDAGAGPSRRRVGRIRKGEAAAG